MAEKACRKCMKIIDSAFNNCDICGSQDLTSEWSGLVIILDPKRSEIANKMNISSISAMYALKVR